MFSNLPPPFRRRTRIWGIGLGSLIRLAVLVALISARTLPFSLTALLIAFLAAAAARHRLGDAEFQLDAVTLSLFALIFYVGLSALWAVDPLASLQIALVAFLVASGSLALMGLMGSERGENALHTGGGLWWIGLSVGLLYTIIEILSGQAIKMSICNGLGLGPEVLESARYFTWEHGRIVAISSDALTRNAAPIPLLLWPALMTVRALPTPMWRSVVYAGLMILSAAAILLGPNETAKLALLAGVAVFAIARHFTQAVRYGLMVAWLVACLGIAPAALLAHRLELHNAPWLQLSAQKRIIIWNDIATLIAESPLLGIGARMTYVTRPAMQEAPEAMPVWQGQPIAHPHNVYLQTWFELGLLGAVLLTLFGVAVLRSIASVEKRLQPFAFAMFASAAVLISSSYGMWQIWFMSLLGFAACLFALGAALMERDLAPEPKVARFGRTRTDKTA